MNLLLILVVAVAGVVSFLLLRGPGRRGGRGGVDALRARALRQLQLPPKRAEEALDRQLADMNVRFPGRSTAWHLRKILTDIERDRR